MMPSGNAQCFEKGVFCVLWECHVSAGEPQSSRDYIDVSLSSAGFWGPTNPSVPREHLLPAPLLCLLEGGAVAGKGRR